jgi:hypothetical protein
MSQPVTVLPTQSWTVANRFLRENASPVTRTVTLAPRQRFTLDVGTIPELMHRSFGIEVTFVQPGVAERSMYFGTSPLWTAGHESAGATRPQRSGSWPRAPRARSSRRSSSPRIHPRIRRT